MGLGKPIELTSTEFSLLELLARQAGKPVPKDEIYVKVLGRQMGPYDRAIDVCTSRRAPQDRRRLSKAVLIERRGWATACPPALPPDPLDGHALAFPINSFFLAGSSGSSP